MDHKIMMSNCVVGAVAVGDGAKVEGHVTVGGAKTPGTGRLSVKFDASNCTPERLVKKLKTLIESIEGDYYGAHAFKHDDGDVAWSVEDE